MGSTIEFCPLCQESVEVDETTHVAYRLNPERRKCQECHSVTKHGITGWRPNEPTSLRILRTATNLLMNYVELKPGIPSRMHFTDHYFITRVISDRDTGKEKPIQSLVFWVDELDGEPAAKTFSILSKKLAAQLEPHLEGRKYQQYDFVITEFGDGFYKEWNVQAIKRPEAG